MAEVVVLEIDVSSIAKGLADAQTQLEIYKRGMEDAIEQNGRFSEAANLAAAQVQAQAKEVKQVEGALLRLTQAEKALGGSVNDLVKTYDASNKSIDQNRKVLNALTAEYVKTANPSKEFTARIKNISDTLKQQEGVIGDTRRNVGNYFNEFAKGIPGLGNAIEPLKNIGGAFQNIGVNAAGFQAAFLAGIPLIIAGVQGLVSIMQKFDSVTEGLEDTMSGVNFAFDYFISHGNDGSFTDLITNMGKAYDEGVKLSQVMRDLGEAQDFQRVANAQANKEIEALIIKSKDRTKTEQERIAFLDQASTKEEAILKRNLELAEQRVALAQQEFKRVIEAGLNDDKAKKSLNDANVEFINLQRESGNLQEKILNRRNALLEEIGKAEETRNAKRLAELKKIQDEEAKIADLNLKNEQQIIIEQSRLSQLAIDNAKKEAEGIAKAKEEGYKKQTDLQNKTSAEYLAKVERDAQKEIAIEQQKQKDKETVISAGFAFATNLVSQISSAVAESNEQQLESDRNTNDEAQRNLKRRLENNQITKHQFNEESARLDAQLREKERDANRKEWETNKAIQITMAIINTAQSIIAQLSNPTPYVGIALAAFAAATGAAQIGIISAQQPPNFASGVIGLDGPGTETSDSIDAKLSKGESVLTAKATRKYHRQLAYMEMSVGNSPNYQFGKGRFAGGFIPTISDGGFTARETVRQSDSMAFMSAAIREGFANAPAPKLSIVELENKQASRNRSISISEA